MENLDTLKNGVYSLDVNGSPSKMVVLSAKNNNMLAQLFKASANYLVNSPSKVSKKLQSTDKKKLNEDLSLINESIVLSEYKQASKPKRN